MMVNDGMLLDRYFILIILKVCFVMKLGKVGKMVYGYIIKWGIEEDVFVGNVFIGMYVNCGNLRWLKIVFDIMNEGDVVIWIVFVVVYMIYGFLDEVIDVFCRMELDGVKVDLIFWNVFVFGCV